MTLKSPGLAVPGSPTLGTSFGFGSGFGPLSVADPNIYHYGYPAYGTSEPGVALQFLFDEPSGDIVDEVAGLTLTASGTLTYDQDPGVPWQNLSPCIQIGSNGQFYNLSDQSYLAPGTDDIVVEWVAALSSSVGASGDYALIFTLDRASGTRAFTIYQQFNVPTMILIDIHGTGGNRNMSWTIPDMRDDQIHKWRFVVNKTANTAEIFIDGVSYGSVSAGSVGTISAYQPAISNSTFSYRGKVCELRYSTGNTTNNSGGPNGG